MKIWSGVMEAKWQHQGREIKCPACSNMSQCICVLRHILTKKIKKNLFLKIELSRFKNNTHLLILLKPHFQLSSFQKRSFKSMPPGFLKPNSPLAPLGLLRQGHQRTSCCRAGRASILLHTQKLSATWLHSKSVWWQKSLTSEHRAAVR